MSEDMLTSGIRDGDSAAADVGRDAALSLTVRYRARFDECGHDGVLRSSGFVRWAQDCAWMHSESLGFNREWYAARGLWWLVRCGELNVLANVPMGETVSVTTSVVGYRKVWARRRTEVVRPSGERAATAITDWVVTDSRGAPTRVPDEFLALFGTRVTTFVPGRVLLPPAPATVDRGEVVVRPADTDPMAHVNNAAYLDYLEERLAIAGLGDWPGRIPRRYRLEYLVPTAPGDRLTAETWAQGDGIAHRLLGPDGVEVLRATLDGRTANDAFREAVSARRPRHAPGKDAGAG
jgi:acyl-CoA thioester hydrolase